VVRCGLGVCEKETHRTVSHPTAQEPAVTEYTSSAPMKELHSRFVVSLVTTAVAVSFLSAVRAELGDLYGSEFDLLFDYGFDESPDCVTRQPLVRVNGQWPPPTLHVKADDEITLKMTNELVGVAISTHLHGFDQRGTPWEDGMCYVVCNVEIQPE